MRELVMALAIFPFLGAAASAQDFFAVVSIQNQIQDRITYVLTWGGLGARTVTLLPAQGESHFELDQTRIPVITYSP